MIRRVWLFLRLVWREFEPPSCGIPDPYRIRYRFSVRDAWAIAERVHGKDGAK